jgi:hypothetical protein
VICLTFADVSSTLLPTELFSGVSGSAVHALQLSPNGKRLAMLFTAPSPLDKASPPADLLPGVLVYDLEADETLLLGAVLVLLLSASIFVFGNWAPRLHFGELGPANNA